MNVKENYTSELLHLGNRIRKLREKKGYSQEVLGFRSGLHRNYISSLELAQKNPTYTTLIKISRALDITVVDLLTGGNCDDGN